MPRSFQQPLPPMPVDRVDGEQPASEMTVDKVDRLPKSLPLAMAKAKLGACVREAIRPRAMKEFGDKGLVSGVCSGAKVPDYLAEIYRDPKARQRFALALLDGTAVRRRLVLDWEDEEIG